MLRLFRTIALLLGLMALIVALMGPARLRDRRQQLFVHAASRGSLASLRILRVLGADPTSKEAGGHPLYYAAWQGQTEAVTYLLAHGAPPDSREPGGWTPLMAAASRGHAEALGVLLAHRANPNLVASCGNALDMARANGQKACAASLEAAGVRSALKVE